MLFAAFVAVCLWGCKGSSDEGDMYFTIEGTLSGAEDKTLYIEEMTPDNGPHFLDSIYCDKKGHFKYKGSMAYQTFFNLHSSEYDYIVLLPNNGEIVRLTGDYNNFSTNYHVEGSPESGMLWQIMSYVNDANMTISDLVENDRHNREALGEAKYEEAKKVTDSLFREEHNVVYMMFVNFIEDYSGSLSTLYAIDAPFNHVMRVFYPESDFEIFEMVLKGLLEDMPDNPHTTFFRTRVERIRSTRALVAQQQQPGQEVIVR